MELVNEFGFHNTPTSKIAKKAGFSEATIYKHFSNKNELIIATYLKIKSDLTNEVFKDTELIVDDISKTKRILYNYLDYFLINTNQLKYYLQFINSSYMNQIAYEKGKQQLGNLIDHINHGIANKYFKDMPLALYYAFVHVPILEITRLAITDELILTEELKEQVVSNILNSILINKNA